MCGEFAYAGELVEAFAGYHRASYGGCKVGVGDVLIGAEGARTPSGTYLIDMKLANVCKLNVTRFPYQIAALPDRIDARRRVSDGAEDRLGTPGGAGGKAEAGGEDCGDCLSRTLLICQVNRCEGPL